MRDPARLFRRIRRGLALSGCALAALGGAPPLSAQTEPIDPLVLRVQDAIGAPGGTTAVVLRTYASRPVRRGKVTANATTPAAARPDGIPPTNPFSAWLGGYVFDASGQVAATLEPQPDGSLWADFQSLTASINRRDGVFLVLLGQLDPAVIPGSQYTLSAAEVLPLLDPEDDPVLVEFRPGRLRIRAAADPYALGIAQLDVQPGSAGVLEIDSKEPFAIGSGTVVFQYDPSILLPGQLPTVTADPRHGVVALTVDTSTPGTITVDLLSAPGAGEKYFNEEVPGELFRVTIPTRPQAPLATQSNVTFAAGTQLLPPGSATPISLLLENGGMFFTPVPNIFHDNFGIGDAGWWAPVVSGF